MPASLQNLTAHPENLDQALELSAAFHVLELGLHEEWLGHGLIVTWSGHADYPAEAMTIELVELISQIQADPSDAEVANRLNEMQRAIVKGLVPWNAAVAAYAKTYSLCVTARTEIRKEEIVELMEGLPRVVRHLSGLSPTKKYARQKAHNWQSDVSKLLTLAYLCLESHRVTEVPAAEVPEAEATQLEADDSEQEDVDMSADLSALAAAVRGPE